MPVRCKPSAGSGSCSGSCATARADVRNYLLEHDILTGTSNDPNTIRILAPLTLEARHVTRLAGALATLAPVGT